MFYEKSHYFNSFSLRNLMVWAADNLSLSRQNDDDPRRFNRQVFKRHRCHNGRAFFSRSWTRAQQMLLSEWSFSAIKSCALSY